MLLNMPVPIPNRFPIKHLLIPILFLHNQKFIFLLYISAKDKYTTNNFRSNIANIFHIPSSCDALVHNTENFRMVGVFQRIILAVVHCQKIFFAVHNNACMVNSWHSANRPSYYVRIITIRISGTSRADYLLSVAGQYIFPIYYIAKACF